MNEIFKLKRKPNLVFVKSIHVSHFGPFCAMHVLVGRPEGRRSLGRPRHKSENNIKMGVQAVGCVACSGLIWSRIGAGGGIL
jgi:hypothetical protein